MLQIWYNENDWVIADGKEDAIKVWEETIGDKWSDYLKNEDLDAAWIVWYNDDFTMSFDEEEDRDNFSPVDAQKGRWNDNGSYWARAKQAQWVEKVGRGFLASENW